MQTLAGGAQKIWKFCRHNQLTMISPHLGLLARLPHRHVVPLPPPSVLVAVAVHLLLAHPGRGSVTWGQVLWGRGEALEGGQGAHRGHRVAAGATRGRRGRHPRCGAADCPVGVGCRVVVGVKAAPAAAAVGRRVMTRCVTVLVQSIYPMSCIHILVNLQ